MLCSNCQIEFDDEAHLPRILIFCGHTYCHSCIGQWVSESPSGFPCPDCSTQNVPPNGVESFPKNLVLLSVPKQKAAKSESNQNKVCSVHSKKLEAFCEKDKEVLCIDCILSDKHKSHEIIAIQKAAERQRVFLLEEVTTAQKTEEKLKYITTDIKKYVAEMYTQVEKNRNEVSQIYNQIRELLLEREQAQKKQISDNLIKEEQDCKDALSQIVEMLGKIQTLKTEMIGASNEDDLDLVCNAKYRVNVCNEVNGQQSKDLSNYDVSKATLGLSFIEIKKEQELIQISKILHPQYKGSVSSTLYSHTASTANKVKKAGTINERDVSQHKQVEQRNPREEFKRNNKVAKKQSPNRNTRAKKTGQPNLKKGNSTKNDQILPGLMQVPHAADDDSIDDTNVVDDMSVIPPESECYYQYSPREKEQTKGQNLNDLLESLDKSGICQDQPANAYNQESAGESSTTEEAQKPRSMSRDNQKQKDKKTFEMKGSNQSPMMTPNSQANKIQLVSENCNWMESYGQKESSTTKNKRCKTLERVESPVKKEGYSYQYLGNSETKNQNLSKVSSRESPNKKQETGKEAANLMVMLQEATKTIDKLEFKQRSVQKEKSDEKQTKPVASICLVDLSKEADDLRLKQEIETEAAPSQAHPTISSPPQKQIEADEAVNDQSLISKYEPFSSPNKQTIQNNADSPQKLTGETMDVGHMSFQSQNEVSIADPFKALGRFKEELIFVFSGFNDSKLYTCEAFDVSRGIWKEICQIQKPRTKFSAVSISKSRILLFGGKQIDGQRTSFIEEYNLKNNKFKELPFKMPKPRSGFASCVKKDEGKIFFCGGNSGSVLRKFDCLDLKKGKWSRLPDMIQKRDELAVTLGPDGMVYAIGGYGGGSQGTSGESSSGSSNCLQTAERFNFSTQEWEMLPPMTEARRALAAVSLPDGIYAIGGYDGKQYLSTVEKFDLSKQKWVTIKAMNQSRCTLSAVASQDCQFIYALGGFNGTSLDIVERYNSLSDTWEFIAPMSSKRFMHEAVSMTSNAFQ